MAGISGGINVGVGPGGINVRGGVSVGVGGIGVSASLTAAAPSFVLPGGNWTPALFVPHRRSIGGIIAQVTIDEQHTDEVQITDHPIEAGAPVSDHAFKRPVEVNIRAAWSTAVAYDLSAESGVYGLLLSWQAAFMPFDVYTGKRHYTNMLMERLVVTTDQHNEFTLMAQIMCRQVIIVNTTSTMANTTSNTPAGQSEPDKTSPPAQKGDQPPASVGNGDLLTPDTRTVGDTVVGQPYGNPIQEGDVGSQPETPTAQTVESTAIQNSAPDGGPAATAPVVTQSISEKGMTYSTSTGGEAGVTIPVPPPPGDIQQPSWPLVTIQYQRPRGRNWQSTSRSRRSPVSHSLKG